VSYFELVRSVMSLSGPYRTNRNQKKHLNISVLSVFVYPCHNHCPVAHTSELKPFCSVTVFSNTNSSSEWLLVCGIDSHPYVRSQDTLDRIFLSINFLSQYLNLCLSVQYFFSSFVIDWIYVTKDTVQCVHNYLFIRFHRGVLNV